MFIQIHMLQSMPPGNVNRDDTGQPKKCIFGGVTRGRISSQCLKRNIRHSSDFKEAFGDNLAALSQYLPRMVADEFQKRSEGVSDEELNEIMAAIAKRFKKSERGSDSETQDDDEDSSPVDGGATDGLGKTGQLVFFHRPFAVRVAELIADLRESNERAYNYFIGRAFKPKPSKKDENSLKAAIKCFVSEVSKASMALTVDIALFGRMTTSDIIEDVEAACQVAHAIGTHETIIEGDYFTAMDDLKTTYVATQMERAGAAYLGRGENVTFFNSSVYYKYFNLDVEALQKHLPSLTKGELAHVAEVFVRAAAWAHPTGKQNSLANPTVPEVILIEVSAAKRPISYANAFVQPVAEGPSRNLTTESARALYRYVDAVASAFAPSDVRRLLLDIVPDSPPLRSKHRRLDTIDDLAQSVARFLNAPERSEVTA